MTQIPPPFGSAQWNTEITKYTKATPSEVNHWKKEFEKAIEPLMATLPTWAQSAEEVKRMASDYGLADLKAQGSFGEGSDFSLVSKIAAWSKTFTVLRDQLFNMDKTQLPPAMQSMSREELTQELHSRILKHVENNQGVLPGSLSSLLQTPNENLTVIARQFTPSREAKRTSGSDSLTPSQQELKELFPENFSALSKAITNSSSGGIDLELSMRQLIKVTKAIAKENREILAALILANVEAAKELLPQIEVLQNIAGNVATANRLIGKLFNDLILDNDPPLKSFDAINTVIADFVTSGLNANQMEAVLNLLIAKEPHDLAKNLPLMIMSVKNASGSGQEGQAALNELLAEVERVLGASTKEQLLQKYKDDPQSSMMIAREGLFQLIKNVKNKPKWHDQISDDQFKQIIEMMVTRVMSDSNALKDKGALIGIFVELQKPADTFAEFSQGKNAFLDKVLTMSSGSNRSSSELLNFFFQVNFFIPIYQKTMSREVIELMIEEHVIELQRIINEELAKLNEQQHAQNREEMREQIKEDAAALIRFKKKLERSPEELLDIISIAFEEELLSVGMSFNKLTFALDMYEKLTKDMLQENSAQISSTFKKIAKIVSGFENTTDAKTTLSLIFENGQFDPSNDQHWNILRTVQGLVNQGRLEDAKRETDKLN